LSETAPSPRDDDLVEDADFYDEAPCGFLSLTPSGAIFKANATLSAWTGVSSEQLIGKRFVDLLTVPSRVYNETHVAPLLRMQGFANEFALDFQTSSGERLAVLLNAAEKRDSSGNVVLTRFVIFQATQRRHYERELVNARRTAEEARTALQALNTTLEDRIAEAVAERLKAEEGLLVEQTASELREQFIAVLGHDLRNPLASIGAGIRLLKRTTLESKAVDLLGMMQSSVDRMARLIDNVLDFARGRLGGGLTLTRSTDASIEPMLRHVVEELRAAWPDRKIEVDIDLQRPLDCDPGRIGQLFSNLLGNALTHGDRAKPVRVEASDHSGTFRLAIMNAGEAIPAAAMERLFGPFARGADRSDGMGLGLGLYIASEIAKAHDGRIDVTSSATETRFTFTMPTQT
jgi:sigma-B regulation protein RsbU (phosphoserine phosphatase)